MDLEPPVTEDVGLEPQVDWLGDADTGPGHIGRKRPLKANFNHSVEALSGTPTHPHRPISKRSEVT